MKEPQGSAHRRQIIVHHHAHSHITEVRWLDVAGVTPGEVDHVSRKFGAEAGYGLVQSFAPSNRVGRPRRLAQGLVVGFAVDEHLGANVANLHRVSVDD